MVENLDRSLLTFASYSDYLNSFIKSDDYLYLGSMGTVRRFVKLGYRCSSKVFEESEFHKIRHQLAILINPKVTSDVLYGRYFKGTDAALKALMEREEPNMLRKLSTIIFLQVRQRSGFDISGYIDFEKSLRDCNFQKPDRTNWKSVFEGKTLLTPKPTDLSYYDWHKGIVYHNNTDNFHAVNGGESLIFMHKADHKLVPMTDKPSIYSINVVRRMIKSELYGFMTLYDHVVR
ncbi:hypothetical protein ACLKA7_001116 [Drosophila subpalustris]